ncbi:hypothetical protein [Sphingomonas aurantiaca]|uniref:hypothetical protein n=1 Tax=Sphingomonas aurantiaca TaxID=185949 RepID=UPI002FE0D9DD
MNADMQMGGDVCDPAGAGKRVRQLFEGFPGKPVEAPVSGTPPRSADMRTHVAALLLGATVFASGAAGMATGAGDTGRLALPTYSQAYTPTTVDERGVWMEADEDERRLRESPSVIRDPALNAYVRGVLCRTVGDDRCRSVRIYIERVPAFNASMAPNGTMIVWSGLLLRVRNEAEPRRHPGS